MRYPTIRGLADLISAVPRRPRLEMHCHPSVLDQLRDPPPEGPSFMALGLVSGGLLTSIPVFEHEDMPHGAWEIRADGVVTRRGSLSVPGLEWRKIPGDLE